MLGILPGQKRQRRHPAQLAQQSFRSRSQGLFQLAFSDGRKSTGPQAGQCNDREKTREYHSAPK